MSAKEGCVVNCLSSLTQGFLGETRQEELLSTHEKYCLPPFIYFFIFHYAVFCKFTQV